MDKSPSVPTLGKKSPHSKRSTSRTHSTGGGPLAGFDDEGKESNASLSEAKGKRMVFVSNHLPIKMSRNEVEQCYTFELDEDALLVQAAKDAVPEDMTPIYVGCLSKEVPLEEQDEVSAVLQKQHNCYPVFLGEVRRRTVVLGRGQ